jgi:predicted PurR-regulated permease PerM
VNSNNIHYCDCQLERLQAWGDNRLAFTVSPLKAVLTLIAFFIIQQVEGNFLLPRIQGQALQIHPVPILLAVIVGWGLFGIVGMVLAIPALAVMRVLYGFFSVRLSTRQ